MTTNSATTVEEYINALPPDRRQMVAAVREIVMRHLPDGYGESMHWGMISYEIPLEHYPDTYNGQPLSYVALPAQKNCFSLYLMGVYQDSKQKRWLRDGFETAGLRLDMGKSCVHFRKLDDLPLKVIGRVIASTSPAEFIARYELSRKLR